MSGRERDIEAFLARAGWASARRSKLAGDASARRYERVTKAGATAVLMDAPPEPGEVSKGQATGYSAAARLAVGCGPFSAIAHYLRAEGLSAPEILFQDIPQGLMLLEDLGDDLFVRKMDGAKSAGAEDVLYGAAIDLLAAFHTRPAPEEIKGADGPAYRVPRYEASVYQVEADLLIDWYVPALRGAPVLENERAAYHASWARAFAAIANATPVLALRDFHAGNLIWLNGRKGVQRIGLLDFQDGLIGHPAYDVVSLLQDARRDVSPQLEARMLARYIAASKSRPGFSEEEFRSTYAILGAQRNAKIVGIFTRLSRRDGKPVYLQHLPRVWRYLERDLAHPALAAVAELLAEAVPAAERTRCPTPAEPGFAPPERKAS